MSGIDVDVDGYVLVVGGVKTFVMCCRLMNVVIINGEMMLPMMFETVWK